VALLPLLVATQVICSLIKFGPLFSFDLFIFALIVVINTTLQ
jgi:hypothetical protein